MRKDPRVSSELFLRSQAWLFKVYGQQKGTLAFNVRILIAAWICERATGIVSAEFDSIAQDVRRALIEVPEPEPLLRLDSRLWLLSCLVLQRKGLVVPMLNDMCESLSGELSLSDCALAEYTAEAVLLNQLGYLYIPQPLAAALEVPDKIFLAGPATLRKIAAEIAAATLFGAAPSRVRKYRSLCEALLIGATIARLRRYDLELGSTLLRSLRYAGLRMDPYVSDGVEFLRDQQCENGTFGHFAAEEKAIELAIKTANGAMSAPSDVIDRLFLPVTLSCLWTLAEVCFPNFLLFYPNGISWRQSDSIDH